MNCHLRSEFLIFNESADFFMQCDNCPRPQTIKDGFTILKELEAGYQDVSSSSKLSKNSFFRFKQKCDSNEQKILFHKNDGQDKQPAMSRNTELYLKTKDFEI